MTRASLGATVAFSYLYGRSEPADVRGLYDATKIGMR